MTPNQISLARVAIIAKVAYWDALRAFEIATSDDSNNWSDRTNDQVCATVENVATCAGDTAEDLTDEDLELDFGFLSNTLTPDHPL